MNVSDWIKRGLDMLAQEFPVTFTYLGTTHTGVVGTTKDTKQMREAGFMADSDLTIRIAASEFAVQPVANGTIMVGSVQYVIQNVNIGPDGDGLALVCNRTK